VRQDRTWKEGTVGSVCKAQNEGTTAIATKAASLVRLVFSWVLGFQCFQLFELDINYSLPIRAILLNRQL
jgi:hypothetical protein